MGVAMAAGILYISFQLPSLSAVRLQFTLGVSVDAHVVLPY